jgi:hypothetical protein
MPSLSSFYLLTSNSFNFYLKTEEFKRRHSYIFTNNLKSYYLLTEEFKKKAAYFYTNSYKASYVITEDFKKKTAYFLTNSLISKYIFTEELDTSAYPNICHYPKELDIIRQNAVLLIWKENKDKLKKSLSAESWGKIDTCGYTASGSLRLLLDYLSSIWMERDADSKSGLFRTSDFYYKKYVINDIIVNFRECDINIKPIVALFNLNSYSVQDGEWPNYFIINNILNPLNEEGMPTLKQYTDIFTLDTIVLDSNQSRYPITNAKTNFPLTKQLKYLTSFSINGSDYIGYVDYNYTSVTYSPPVIGYTITSSDTVTITYWYEE